MKTEIILNCFLAKKNYFFGLLQSSHFRPDRSSGRFLMALYLKIVFLALKIKKKLLVLGKNVGLCLYMSLDSPDSPDSNLKLINF